MTTARFLMIAQGEAIWQSLTTWKSDNAYTSTRFTALPPFPPFLFSSDCLCITSGAARKAASRTALNQEGHSRGVALALFRELSLVARFTEFSDLSRSIPRQYAFFLAAWRNDIDVPRRQSSNSFRGRWANVLLTASALAIRWCNFSFRYNS